MAGPKLVEWEIDDKGTKRTVMAPEDATPEQVYAKAKHDAAGLPSRITSAYKSVAEPVTNAVAGGVTGLMNAIASGFTTPGTMDQFNQQAGRFIAEGVVPQSPLEAGIMAGTAGAGGLAAKMGMKGAAAAGTRILGAVAGGEAGGQVTEGAKTGQGAIQGGVAGLGGEIVGTASNLVRNRPGSIAFKLSERGSDRWGNLLERTDPQVFAGARTPQQLRELVVMSPDPKVATSIAAQRLKEAQSQAFNRVEQILDNLPVPGGKLWEGVSSGTGPVTAKQTNLLPNPFYGLKEDAPQYVPLVTAKKNLSDLYDWGWKKGIAPENLTKQGVNFRERYGQSMEAIHERLADLDPSGAASAIWNQAREQYKVSRTLINTVAKGFKSSSAQDVPFFDDTAVMNYLNDKKTGSLVKAKVGPQVWTEIGRDIFENQPQGTTNVLNPPAGMIPRLTQHIPGLGYMSERMIMPRPLGQPFHLSPMQRVGIDLGADIGTQGPARLPEAQGFVQGLLP